MHVGQQAASEHCMRCGVVEDVLSFLWHTYVLPFHRSVCPPLEYSASCPPGVRSAAGSLLQQRRTASARDGRTERQAK